MPEINKTFKTSVLIFIFSLIFFTLGLYGQEFVRIACRYGVFAMEIEKYGAGIFPTLYNKAYPDYPSTQSIFIWLASVVSGGVTPFAAALPSATAAALTLTFVYLTGLLRSEKTGVYAVLTALGTYGFTAFARTPTPDHFTTLFTAAAFYSAACFVFRKKKYIFFFMPVCLAGGFLFRGPIGVVVPAGAVFGLFLYYRRWKELFILSIFSGFTLLSCIALLALLARIQGGGELLSKVIDAQVAGRFSKSRPFYYYFLNAPGIYAMSFPLAALAVFSRRKKLFRLTGNMDSDFLSALTVWALIVICGLSIPGTKHIRYILPAVPPMALLGAYVFTEKKDGFLLKVKSVIVQVFIFLPFIVFPAGILVLIIMYIVGGTVSLAPLAVSGLLMAASVFTLRLSGKDDTRTLPGVTIGVLSVVISILVIAEPVEQYLEGSAAFVREVERSRGKRDIVFCRIGPDGEDVKYVSCLPEAFTPRFIYSYDEAGDCTDAVVIIKSKEMKFLSDDLLHRMKVLAEGKLGHRKVTALEVPPRPASEKRDLTRPQTR